MNNNAKKFFLARLTELQGNMSNVEFAKTCGLNTQDIQRYSHGLAYPTIEKLTLIATAFSVSTDWLLGLSNTKTNNPEVCVKNKIIALKTAATQICANADALLRSISALENL